MQITINNGRLAQISETLTPANGMKLPVNISGDGDYNFLTGEVTITTSDVGSETFAMTASALTQEEYFNSVANGLVDTINEKANTSGQKGLDEAWKTAQGIESMPKITLTLSQVISQDPLTVQLTQEQIDVVESIAEGDVLKFDVTEFGFGVLNMVRSGAIFGIVTSCTTSETTPEYITSTTISVIRYDESLGTMEAFQSDYLHYTGDADAYETDVLYGKTFYGLDGDYRIGEILTKTSADLSASGATVTVPAGYYASQYTKSVTSGTAGTPTATKGAVSNHAVSITPSVTNTSGYITGGTKTGTAVSVQASELVSGTYSINDNGTYDITNYANVTVAIPVYDGTVVVPNSTISFSINNITYQAESGMTWTQWVASAYNTDGFAIVNDGVAMSGYFVYDSNGIGVDPTDAIIANGQYQTGGGGAND